VITRYTMRRLYAGAVWSLGSEVKRAYLAGR
jgi:hypothetical protein